MIAGNALETHWAPEERIQAVRDLHHAKLAGYRSARNLGRVQAHAELVRSDFFIFNYVTRKQISH